jgi:ABC-2 type transport system permease protein
VRVLYGEVLTSLKLYSRNRHALVPTAGFPVLFMLLFSYMFRGQSMGGIPAVAYVFASILGMSMGGTAFLNLSINLVEERDKGILKRLRGTPLRQWQLLGGKVLSAAVVILVQILLIFAIGILLFGLRLKGAALPSFAILAMGTLTFLTMGFCLAGLMKNARAAEAWALALLLPMLFIGGGFFPLESLPQAVQYLAQGLPVTHLYQSLVLVMVEGKSVFTCSGHLLVLALWAGACFGVALKTFRWES